MDQPSAFEARFMVILETDFQRRRVIFDSQFEDHQGFREKMKDVAFGSLPMAKTKNCLKFHKLDGKNVWSSTYRQWKTKDSYAHSSWSGSMAKSSSLSSGIQSGDFPDQFSKSTGSSGFCSDRGTFLSTPSTSGLIKRPKSLPRLAVAFISEQIDNHEIVQHLITRLKQKVDDSIRSKQFIPAMQSAWKDIIKEINAFWTSSRILQPQPLWMIEQGAAEAFVNELMGLKKTLDTKENNFFLRYHYNTSSGDKKNGNL